jgi:hypothetical protein
MWVELRRQYLVSFLVYAVDRKSATWSQVWRMVEPNLYWFWRSYANASSAVLGGGRGQEGAVPRPDPSVLPRIRIQLVVGLLPLLDSMRHAHVLCGVVLVSCTHALDRVRAALANDAGKTRCSAARPTKITCVRAAGFATAARLAMDATGCIVRAEIGRGRSGRLCSATTRGAGVLRGCDRARDRLCIRCGHRHPRGRAVSDDLCDGVGLGGHGGFDPE